MPVHSGHRQRLKKQFMENGLDSFTDIQALELMLYYAIPQKDTNPIAHSLLERFGSFSQVLDASCEELEKVPGIGENAALLLHLFPQAARVYMKDRSSRQQILTTLDSCAEYLLPYFVGRTVELVYLLCMDAKCKVLACKEVGEGSVNSAGLSIRRVVETALTSGASTVVLAHNHPSGIALPSVEDQQTTRRVAAALRSVEIVLADHIIVADGDYVSFAQSGALYRSCLQE